MPESLSVKVYHFIHKCQKVVLKVLQLFLKSWKEAQVFSPQAEHNSNLSKLQYSAQRSLFAQIINQGFFWSTKLGAGLLVISRRVL